MHDVRDVKISTVLLSIRSGEYNFMENPLSESLFRTTDAARELSMSRFRLLLFSGRQSCVNEAVQDAVFEVLKIAFADVTHTNCCLVRPTVTSIDLLLGFTRKW